MGLYSLKMNYWFFFLWKYNRSGNILSRDIFTQKYFEIFFLKKGKQNASVVTSPRVLMMDFPTSKTQMYSKRESFHQPRRPPSAQVKHKTSKYFFQNFFFKIKIEWHQNELIVWTLMQLTAVVMQMTTKSIIGREQRHIVTKHHTSFVTLKFIQICKSFKCGQQAAKFV